MRKLIITLVWALVPVAAVYAYNSVGSGISVNPPRYVIYETKGGKVIKLDTETGSSWYLYEGGYSGLQWRMIN